MRLATFALLLIVACSHRDTGPAAPIDPPATPPLPPASGTPIGFLIDDAGDMHLSDDQVVKLRDIDTSLAAELEVIDSQVRSATRPPDPDPSQQQPRRGGRHGGMGMGGGGMGGGGGGGGGGGRHRGSGAGAGSGARAANAANVDKLTEQRTADVRDALHRAFDLLDPHQQETAKKVLAAHDVDLDTGATPPTPGASDGAPPVFARQPPAPPADSAAPPVFIKPPASSSSSSKKTNDPTAAPPPVFIKPPPRAGSAAAGDDGGSRTRGRNRTQWTRSPRTCTM